MESRYWGQVGNELSTGDKMTWGQFALGTKCHGYELSWDEFALVQICMGTS